MRTTVTLDPDSAALLRQQMAERHLSMKAALNEAVRTAFGTANRPSAGFQTPTADLGLPVVNLDRALQIAADLEDEEMVRNARAGK